MGVYIMGMDMPNGRLKDLDALENEYISKQAFNDAIREAVRMCPNTFYNGLEVARQIAHNMDAADVRPVVQARWNRRYDDFMKSTYDTCSNCGMEYFGAKGFRFCPNCGADMREVDDED